MAKKVIGKSVRPPTGWKFSDGFIVPSEGFTEAAFDTLYAWAKQKKYGLEPDAEHWDRHISGVYLYCRYRVWVDSWEITERWLGDGTWTVRNKQYSLGKVEVNIGGVSYWNQCSNCLRGALGTHMTGRSKNQKRLCPVCCHACKTDGCNGWVANNTAIEPKDKCFDCTPRERCRYCGTWHPEGNLVPLDGRYKGYFTCKPCAVNRTCERCKEASNHVNVSAGVKRCPKCEQEVLDEEREKHEKFDPAELPIGGTFVMESLPNRPIRTVSIETEVNGDPTALAGTLYKCGIVRERIVESYGTQCPDTTHWPAFLKYDGSVTGGELISFLLQLDKPAHATAFMNTLSKMRSLEKMKKVEYGFTCGGHIHIDAHNFSTDNIWRLVTGYNYLEDVIFRLAGAGHAYGHRTLVPGHDRPNHGRGYSHPTAKGPWGVLTNAARAIGEQDRMTGLNFQPYLRAVRYCECGAKAENLRSCKCKLPKCTIEWRVWNSTGHPRILYAWLAFMQSLHAWADSPKEMTEAEERDYAPLEWTKRAWQNTSAGHQTLARERVKWIFENLVFTKSERDALVFAFQQTDMTFPSGFWDEVAAIPTPKNRNVKAPRNCIIRTKEIKISPPKAGIKPTYDAQAARHHERLVRAAARYAAAGRR